MKRAVRWGMIATGVALPTAIAVALFQNGDTDAHAYFASTALRTADGKLLPAERLGNSDYCGHCHTQIFHEWNASTHHFSSMNNPVYRSVALSTAERRGSQVLKFCAGCHDPLPLAAGEVPFENTNQWSANAGITCLACHRITEVHGGNAAYTVSAPTLHPFALSDHPWLQALHRWSLERFPGLHRSVLSKPLYKQPGYCATCHTVVVTKEMNGSGDLVLQNEYASWHKSGFAAAADGSGEMKSCIDCHMPQVSSSDPAAKDGLARSHRFAGGNTLLPHLNRDHEQLRASESFLRSGAVRLRCLRIARGTEDPGSCEGARAAAGDALEMTFEIDNAGVGHDFPGGTNDSNQVWVELLATDARGIKLLHSGALTAGADPDASAYMLRTEYVDKQGALLDRRTSSTDAAARSFSNVLAAGEKRAVPYSLMIGDGAQFPITVNARLNWRKFSTAFLRGVFDASTPGDAPLTVIDEVSVRIDAPPP